MGLISKETAQAIALAYREVDVGEKLLKEVRETIDTSARRPTDIRDAFGRVQHGLQLGVPSGDSGQRLFNVPYPLAIPIIEAHVAQQRALIATLTTLAQIEALPSASTEAAQ
jgi:hypothetical protein